MGATGLIGKSLVAQLIDEESVEKIVTFTRRPVQAESPKVVNKVIDFDKMENYKSDFVGDFLFSCLGTTKKRAGSREAQRRVDIDYQLKAAEIAAANQVPHYLLVSSAGANKDSPSQYMKMKGELEERIMSLPFKRISIFQPSLLLGKRGCFRLSEYVGGLILPVICSLPFLMRYRPIHGATVAQKMIQVTSKPSESRKTYTLDEVFP